MLSGSPGGRFSRRSTRPRCCLPEVDQLWVRRLGIDEHRYRSVRWFRADDGGWRRLEPWMSTIVDADSGQVLGIVDGRDSAAVGAG